MIHVNVFGSWILLGAVAAIICGVPQNAKPKPKTEITLRVVTTIETFEVSGESVEEVAQSLRIHGPRDQQLVSRDAYTFWDLKWNWRSLNNGLISLSGSHILLTTTIRLPRLRSDSEQLKQQWGRYRRKLVAHEIRHLNLAAEGAERLKTRIETAGNGAEAISFDQAQQIAKKIIEEIRASDIEYDQLTDNGATEGVRFLP